MLPEDTCADAHERARDRACLERALSLPLVAALATPLLISLQGALPVWQVMALASCLLPMAAILLLQRKLVVPAQNMLLLSLCNIRHYDKLVQLQLLLLATGLLDGSQEGLRIE